MGIFVTFKTDDLGSKSIAERYWKIDDKGEFLETVSQITNDTGLNTTKILKIVSSACEAVSDEDACDECGKKRAYTSRSDYLSCRTIGHWICADCRQSQFEAEQEKRRQQEEERIALKRTLLEEIITDCDEHHGDEYNVGQLSFKHCVSLYSLMNFGADENFIKIEPINSPNEIPFSPFPEQDQNLVQELFREDLINISTLTDLKAFTISEEGTLIGSFSDLTWRLPNFIEGESFLHVYLGLEQRIKEDQNFKEAEVRDFCLELTLNECLAFLDYSISDYDMRFNPGNKTIHVLKEAISLFPLSQIYNFIFGAVKNAATYSQKSGVHISRAVNSIPGNIERRIENTLNNQWETKAFHRNYHLPQSVISRVVFNKYLGTNDRGFNLAINDILDERFSQAADD